MNSHLLMNSEAISIIVRVSSLMHAGNVFNNYMQQNLDKKELILVHNNPLEDFDQWVHSSGLYPMTRVYQLDDDKSLGECLNYCTERAIFENIAIFQEMHQYEPEYLSSSLREMYLHSAEVTGKKTYFSQCGKEEPLTLVNPGFEKSFTDRVILPTFIFRRELFDSISSKGIRFNNSNEDLDAKFCEDCRNNGCRIYSNDTAGFRYRCL